MAPSIIDRVRYSSCVRPRKYGDRKRSFKNIKLLLNIFIRFLDFDNTHLNALIIIGKRWLEIFLYHCSKYQVAILVLYIQVV